MVIEQFSTRQYIYVNDKNQANLTKSEQFPDPIRLDGYVRPDHIYHVRALYHEELAGSDGMSFWLFFSSDITLEEKEEIHSLFRRSRDVIRFIDTTITRE